MNRIFSLSILVLLCSRFMCLTLANAASGGSFSSYANYPPKIDGIVSENEWSIASRTIIQDGVMLVQNDAANLYLLIDLAGDTNNDPPLATTPWGDYFLLAFDVNIDRLMTGKVDILYGLHPGTHNIGKQYFIGPGWGGIDSASSQLGAGFGSSPNSAVAHRIWELAISLPEIKAVPGSLVRLGLKTYSQTPSFTHEQPPGFLSSFSNLVEINLASSNVDLLVLADESFLSALKPLKEHKDYTGIFTYIQGWQSINKSFTDEGRDEPERIKKAIAVYNRYCHARWVMLVGDCTRFPVRYTMTDSNNVAAFKRTFYSADLYYACLYRPGGGYVFDDWDANRNGYYGELEGGWWPIIGSPNIDQVDPNPDISVGRVPASTIAQVTTYVNKVINYEFAAYTSEWFKRALMVATTDWVPDACLTKEHIVNNYLADFQITRLYSSGNPYGLTPIPNVTSINNALNLGVGFANYYGHGSTSGWSIPTGGYNTSDTAGLTNSGMLPVAFGAACFTSHFTSAPPGQPYLDILGNFHNGTERGEVFYSIPPQPAAIQRGFNPDCFGEHVLLDSGAGFIGYVGCMGASQPWCSDLDKFFFEARSGGAQTLGDMWKVMVQKYYQAHPIPPTISPPDWYKVVEIHQPWKFHLFGDPSLRVGGIPGGMLGIQKQDFVGAYRMVHDGWNGTLILRAAGDAYLENLPNMFGTYTSEDGHQHIVYGKVRTWEYPLPESWGPDHKIEFYIDLADTPQSNDDQKFEGYLFTKTKNAMAGTTWWNNMPFGFYATRILETYVALTFQLQAGGVYHPVVTVSNSIVENPNFDEKLKKISLNVNGPPGTTGLCNITIPATLMRGNFSVYVDGVELTKYINYTQIYNETHNTFCINYVHSTHIIKIIATNLNLPKTDVNGDGAVNIVDITLVAKAFGATLKDSNWNSNADLDGNGTINILDITLVARDFGKKI